MKVFVAGGSGAVGRPAVAARAAAGHEVRATARGDANAAVVAGLGAQTVDVDLFDATAVKAAVAGSDAVVRLTTKVPSVARFRMRRAWEATNRLRREGGRILADAALDAGAEVYVHESITFLYAAGGDEWLDEDAPVEGGWGPLQVAWASESEADRFAAGGGRGVVLRFASLYAADVATTHEYLRAMRLRALPVIGDGANYFSSLHTADAGGAVALSLQAPSGRYNIGDDEPLPMGDYFDALAAAFSLPRPLRVPMALGTVVLGRGPASYALRSHRIANGRFKEATGWKPAVHDARKGWQRIAAELAATPSA